MLWVTYKEILIPFNFSVVEIHYTHTIKDDYDGLDAPLPGLFSPAWCFPLSDSVCVQAQALLQLPLQFKTEQLLNQIELI